MTMRHVIDGLMQATLSTNWTELSWRSGIDVASISRAWAGKLDGLRMNTLQRVHETSGVPYAMIFEWFKMPADAVLGRIPAVRSST